MMMAEMIIAALMGMDAFMPPRMIAGIALGKSAMEPGTPLMTAALTGMLLHFVLSIVYGLIFAWLVANIRALQSTAAVIAAGTFYGLLLWLINFYISAPPAGWVWFRPWPTRSSSSSRTSLPLAPCRASTSIVFLRLGASPFQQPREHRIQGYRRSFCLRRRYSS